MRNVVETAIDLRKASKGKTWGKAVRDAGIKFRYWQPGPYRVPGKHQSEADEITEEMVDAADAEVALKEAEEEGTVSLVDLKRELGI